MIIPPKRRQCEVVCHGARCESWCSRNQTKCPHHLRVDGRASKAEKPVKRCVTCAEPLIGTDRKYCSGCSEKNRQRKSPVPLHTGETSRTRTDVETLRLVAGRVDTTFRELAAELGLRETALRARVERLREKGYLVGMVPTEAGRQVMG